MEEETTQRRPLAIFDSHHPKHYLALRQLGRRCADAGIDVLWSLRDKDVTAQLVAQDGYKPHILTRAKDGWLGRLSELFAYDWKLCGLIRRHRPFALIGNTFSVAHAGLLTRTPSIVINDDDKWTNPQYPLLAYPFATRVVLPECMPENWGRKTRHYRGLHELAYLHPDTFRPDPDVRARLGVGPDEKLFVLRLVANTATHDIGLEGFSRSTLDRLIERLSRDGKVLISSEAPLPDDLKPLAVPLSASAFHHVVAASDLIVTDGNTVAAEAAVLGVPSIRMTGLTPRSYLIMLEKEFRLTFGYSPNDVDAFHERLEQLLTAPNIGAEWHQRRLAMLETLQDPTPVFWDELSRFLPAACD